ncbi:MAG TPA: alpha/beta hydrolase [Syntrophorhabdaceae bacterium]|nr:alpha/beta hydrolase [Syntrophorhabdaceae bacterium]
MRTFIPSKLKYLFLFVALNLTALCVPGFCSAPTVGVTMLPALGPQSGPLTVWYPSQAVETERTMGPFVLKGAWDGEPVQGNRGLVILSHGTGGSGETYYDLARVLVAEGFVVAAPEHVGDNWRDHTKGGPASWRGRPAEVSQAIDHVQSEARFAALLDKGNVGVFGMSAGGLTALEFSGATWSLARLVTHCALHLEEDIRFCAFGEVRAAGGRGLDEQTIKRLKTQLATGAQSGMVDATEYSYEDKRVKAVVAAVPASALIDPASLRTPRVPTALIAADMDQELAPKWHVLAIEMACTTCVVLATLEHGGHMSILSPMPQGIAHDLGPWAEDPPGFDRKVLTRVYKDIALFFRSHILGKDEAAPGKI